MYAIEKGKLLEINIIELSLDPISTLDSCKFDKRCMFSKYSTDESLRVT